MELKQCGVHLIFEGDDDYDGGQESLDKLKTYNLSQKNWPTFSAIYESGSPIYATDDEDEWVSEWTGDDGTRAKIFSCYT